MKGGSTSGVRNGRLIVSWTRDSAAEEFDLGAVADMPLTVDGTADYNVQNVAGVALAALGLGIPAATVATVLARFGADPTDNPGRLMRYDYRGAQVLIDYAHNPDGLRGLMNVATRLRRTGRVALLLGQAGNRSNADIEELAATAARFRPDFVVVKETESYMRGRAPGEVPAILRGAAATRGPAGNVDRSASERDRCGQTRACVGASRRRARHAGARSRSARRGHRAAASVDVEVVAADPASLVELVHLLRSLPTPAQKRRRRPGLARW